MSGKKIIFYIIIGSFIIGTLLLALLQYNSTRHVNALMMNNRLLLDEFQITNHLLDAAKSKVVIERKIRGFIESGDTAYLAGLDSEFQEIEAAEEFLGNIKDDSISAALIAGFNHALQDKVDLFREVMRAYRKYGVKAAEDTINSNLPLWVSFEIERYARKITDARRTQLSNIAGNVRRSGKKALEFSYIVLGLGVLTAAMVVLYIIYIIKKLISSEKMLRESARVKENFLANMSHEIRTPMNAILGFTQLLSQKKLDDDAKQYVQAIEKSGENLLVIVNDILDISKIEAGMMRIEHVPFSLRGLVNSLGTMIQQRANSKNIQVNVSVSNNTPDILEGDPMRLTQILNNLLGNALKFTTEGTVSLTVNLAEKIGDKVKLRIDVSDTGIGIEPQKLKHIFGRFEQADDTITRQYGGTGLGLSIVRDLVTLQGGAIDVDSEPGRGTSFHVILPYTISQSQVADNISLSDSQQYHPDSRLVVLITEDNEFNQSLLSHIFKNWDLQYEIASNGEEAIRKLKQKKYDLVLMDIQMPVMDGYTAARKIRNELKSDVPIIAMTAHAMPGEREKCLSVGMNEYLAKPVKQEALSDLISRFTSFVQRIPEEEKSAKGINYQYIDLRYLKEVSAGDTEYEKSAVQKFIRAIPPAMDELEQRIQKNETVKIKAIAHNLKTTISVMGLNSLLNPVLDELEYGETDPENTFRKLQDLLTKALEEATLFKHTL